MKKYLFLFLCLGFVFINCKKSEDVIVPKEDAVEDPKEEPKEEPQEQADVTVEDFMWQTMNLYYLWQAEVPNLADAIFPATAADEQAYKDFLTTEPSPADFFTNKLLFSGDRFSGYSENYKELTNFLSGVSKSNGLEFGLSLYGSDDDVLGFVYYIVEGSDAATQDIMRGDIFVGVNGVSLNLNNYQELLFGDSDTYTLNMVDIVDNTLVPNGKEITLTKQEGLVENPVLVSKVIEQSGRKIGYIMYNQFIGGSGELLNQIFGDFKSAGMTDLVLDLRYNLGGRGFTSAILASLIYGTNENELFYKDRYNAKIEADLEPSDYENNFVSTTGTPFGNKETPLNSLNLSKVYILATDNTASASELVMVGLEPYIDVVHIGTRTVGKNQGSNTFVDDPENGNFYNPDRESEINPDNQWALQPIIVTVENADGFSDYSDGLIPDKEFQEDITNLGILGDPNEPMLASALTEIDGSSTKRSFEPQMPVNLVSGSKLSNPLASRLVIDKTPAVLIESIKAKIKKNQPQE